MSQCVPSWEYHDDPPNPNPNPNPHLLPPSSVPLAPLSEYEVTELTWENGQLSAHGLGQPRRINKSTPKYPSSETLEAIVNQAKLLLHHAPVVPMTATASAIGSCNGGAAGRKRARPVTEGRGGSGSLDSTRVTETYGTDDFTGGRGVSTGSPDTENTSFGAGGAGSRLPNAAEELDSACHSRRSSSQSLQRDVAGAEEEKVTDQEGTIRSLTISTKRSRAAAVHNQSERKRRDRINQRMRTLQKLVPSSSKTDKVSMLDEVIEYLKQLQSQVQMMSRMGISMPTMMMPMGIQQFQMSVMAQMAHMAHMGMGLGMIDMGSLGGMQQPVLPDAFLTCLPQQPMTMDAYQRMGPMYQQLFQQAPPMNPK